MGTRDAELKASLLAFFRPVLRFDAGEKHFPVCAETFISSSVLLRRPLTGRLRKQALRRHKRLADQQGDQHGDEHDDEDDEDEDEDEDDDSPKDDAEPDESRQQQQQQQACGVCGQRKGWSIPSTGGWELVSLPSGSESWSSTTLVQEQQRDMLHEFRLEPHSCIWNGQDGGLSAVPCYAFAELLDPSVMAPFIGRAGLGPVYELKYAFLYGYNGTTFAVPGTSVGVHTGDLEHVTIRVDAGRKMILEAFFAAHSTGEGKWVPSKQFYRQVEAWEAAANPGVAAAVPETAREFLEAEVSAADDEDEPVGGAVGTEAPRGERLVIYPARNGHASYHMPKRWRRFGGLGDDVCRGDGKVWRPALVQLDHPNGKTPPWLQFRGRYGAPLSISSEGFWKHRGEAPRRCSAEAKYRSLLEEGLVPDRGVRLGSSRRMLQGNRDRGVWLERQRQTQSRLPLFNTWRSVPGLSSAKPRNEDPPRSPGSVWLANWGFLRDFRGTTDKQGWSYHESQAVYADTGVAGKPKNSGLLVHRSRGRVWFRVAATPDVAKEVEEAQRLDKGRYPPRALALAALDVAGRGEAVTSASILQTMRGDVQKRSACGAIGASSDQEEGAGSSGAAGVGGGGGGGRRVLLSAPNGPALDGSLAESYKSFGSVAAHCLGE